jgi:hypothetical protein
VSAPRAAALAIAAALALLAGCRTTPSVPKQVTVTVTDYRPLPDWIAPVPVYQRSGSTVRDHLTAECRHKQDQATANCLIRAARRIVAGEALARADCPPPPPCEDTP